MSNMNSEMEPGGFSDEESDQDAFRNGWSAAARTPALGPTVAGSGVSTVDFRFLFDVVLRRWRWLAAGSVALGVLGAGFGLAHFQTTYTSVAQLVRYESPNVEEVFRPRQISPQTLADVLRSPELRERISRLAQPPISAEALAEQVRISPEHNSEVALIIVSGNQPDAVVNLANLYAREAVRHTQQLQAREATEINHYLTQQLAHVESEMKTLSRQLPSSPSALVPPVLRAVPRAPRLSQRLIEKLEAARETLVDLRVTYTDIHPSVIEQRAKVAALEKEILESSLGPVAGAAITNQPAETATTAAVAPSEADGAHGISAEIELTIGKLQSLENSRLTLAARQRGAQMFQEHPAGYYRLLAPAVADGVVAHGRAIKVALLAALGTMMGALGALVLVAGVEGFDRRLKTLSDVRRVTDLPVLAAIGNLDQMSLDAQRTWAFRAWIALQGQLRVPTNHGLICGFTSASQGEGRSAWINLLAQAASNLGFRVLTIGARPSTPSEGNPTETKEAPDELDAPALARLTETETPALVASHALASPAHVLQQFTGPESPCRVHIPIPGWVWNRERRQQWAEAINHWRQIENIVILVELPPASQPEAVLLAECLPNLIWLADGNRAEAQETRAQLQLLRHTRCHLVGAVVNRAPSNPLAPYLARWSNGFLIGLGLILNSAASAAPGNNVSHLQVASQSPDGATAVLAVTYNYDGFDGATARLVPMVEKSGDQASAAWFHSAGVIVGRGHGMVLVPVAYRHALPGAPPQFTTDKITVSLTGAAGNMPLAMARLTKTMTWGGTLRQPDAAATAQSDGAALPVSKEPARANPTAAPAAVELPAVVIPNEDAPVLTNFNFSISQPAQRAAWQQKFTLGPGDVLTISVFGQPERMAAEVVVGPDGRVGFLEAHDVLATGLTIDELRLRLEQELALYRRAPRLILTPVEFRSKKYFLLGRIAQKGVFTLDRPTTILEAVARAHGLETGLQGRNVIELADLTHSFLARRGQRLPVDFSKLFLTGDLSQNIALEPDDYLYFPAADRREVYILGEVANPGILAADATTTALGAIASRGGFAAKAWKSKVLVVRGSLVHPETFTVDAGAILAAKTTDFKLQPRDIVYVSRRPWAKAEELLDTAVQAFVQGAVIFWTGGNVGPLIR